MEQKLSAREHAERYGFTEQEIIYRIKKGLLDGFEEDGVSYVLRKVATPSEDSNKPFPANLDSEKETKIVVTYLSQSYIYSLVGIIALGVVGDIVGLALDPSELPRGIGLRIGVLVLIWYRHRWVRKLIKVWSAFMVFAGAVGLWSISILNSGEYMADWWVPVLFVGMISVGVVYFALANKYIKVDVVPV